MLRLEYTSRNSYPIHMALKNNATLDVIRVLANCDETILQTQDKSDKTALSIALQYRAKTEVINWILATDPTLLKIPDFRMNLPLHIVCKYGCDEDILETLLLNSESDVNMKNRDGETPLDLACRSTKYSDNMIDVLRKYELEGYNQIDNAIDFCHKVNNTFF